MATAKKDFNLSTDQVLRPKFQEILTKQLQVLKAKEALQGKVGELIDDIEAFKAEFDFKLEEKKAEYIVSIRELEAKHKEQKDSIINKFENEVYDLKHKQQKELLKLKEEIEAGKSSYEQEKKSLEQFKLESNEALKALQSKHVKQLAEETARLNADFNIALSELRNQLKTKRFEEVEKEMSSNGYAIVEKAVIDELSDKVNALELRENEYTETVGRLESELKQAKDSVAKAYSEKSRLEKDVEKSTAILELKEKNYQSQIDKLEKEVERLIAANNKLNQNFVEFAAASKPNQTNQ